MKLIKLTKWQLFKRRWLYAVSFLFIVVFPLLMITLRMITIKTSKSSVSISFGGFIVGLIYISFIARKIKKKINEMKPSFFKIIINGISNIIPFATVGFLVILIENALKSFDITIWAICISMLIGTLLQAVEFAINKKLLYQLKLQEQAKEEVDRKRLVKLLEEELEEDD